MERYDVAKTPTPTKPAFKIAELFKSASIKKSGFLITSPNKLTFTPVTPTLSSSIG